MKVKIQSLSSFKKEWKSITTEGRIKYVLIHYISFLAVFSLAGFFESLFGNTWKYYATAIPSLLPLWFLVMHMGKKIMRDYKK